MNNNKTEISKEELDSIIESRVQCLFCKRQINECLKEPCKERLLSSSSESKEGVRSAEDCLYERWKEWMEMQFKEPDTSFEVFKDDTSWMFFIPAFEKYANQFKTSQFTPTATDEKEIEALALEKYPITMNYSHLDTEDFRSEKDLRDSNKKYRKCFIEGYTQALQSRVVNVSDEECKQIALQYYPESEDEMIDRINSLQRGVFIKGLKELRSKLSQKSEKEMDEFASDFAEWCSYMNFQFMSDNQWLDDEDKTRFTSELLTTYKESLTVKK